MHPRHILLSALLALPAVSHAELSGENLLQSMPNGYKVGFENRKDQIAIREMVPVNESVENWSEMLTTQIIFGSGNLPPQQFKANMVKLWGDACPNAESQPIRDDHENGYAFSFWLQICPQNSQTGKPEFTLFKAIQGQDSFYVVQKSFAFMPSNEQVTEWTQYMRSIIVCDTRSAEHPCPRLAPAS